MNDKLYKHFTHDIDYGRKLLQDIAETDRVLALLLVTAILEEAANRMDTKPFIHRLGTNL